MHAPQFGTAPAKSNLPTLPSLYSLVRDGLPTLPRFLFALNHQLKLSADGAADDSLHDPQPVLAILRKDPVLAAMVLRLAGTQGRLGGEAPWDLQQIVSGIDASSLRMLALTCAVLPAQEATGGALEEFWSHSYRVARLARAAAHASAYGDPELAYLAGLLHNLGELPLRLSENNSGASVHTLGEERVSLDFERERYGMTHCEIGRSLAIAWSFPPVLVEVIEHHHEPANAVRDAGLCRLIWLADEFLRTHHDMLFAPASNTRFRSAAAFLENLGASFPQLSPAERVTFAAALEEEWHAASAEL